LANNLLKKIGVNGVESGAESLAKSSINSSVPKSPPVNPPPVVNGAQYYKNQAAQVAAQQAAERAKQIAELKKKAIDKVVEKVAKFGQKKTDPKDKNKTGKSQDPKSKAWINDLAKVVPWLT
jgi:hypothetical protein